VKQLVGEKGLWGGSSKKTKRRARQYTQKSDAWVEKGVRAKATHSEAAGGKKVWELPKKGNIWQKKSHGKFQLPWTDVKVWGAGR